MSYYEGALSVVKHLQSQGFTTYFAGGWVRDYLLGHTSDDIDIVTEATVDEIQVLFPKTIPVGVQFGILVVVIDEHQYEVATFRQEAGYEDGRRPTIVKPANPEEDAKRRDLTINGMFYDPVSEEIFDYVEGRADLDHRLIRAIGCPQERFEEDRLRMLRAVRYACRFSFAIDRATYQAILERAKELFPSVAIERVWQELNKMAAFPHFGRAILMLYETRLLAQIFPLLGKVKREEFEQRISYIDLLPTTTPTIAKVVLLFGCMEVEKVIMIMKEMRISNKELSFVTYFLTLKALMESNESLSRYESAKLYANVHFELSFEILKKLPFKEEVIKQYENMHIALFAHTQRLKEKNPIISAQILQEFDVKPGVKMGELLRLAEEISIEENIEDEDQLLERLGLIHLDDKKS